MSQDRKRARVDEAAKEEDLGDEMPPEVQEALEKLGDIQGELDKVWVRLCWIIGSRGLGRGLQEGAGRPGAPLPLRADQR